MKRTLATIFICFFLSYGLYSQNHCDSFYIYHKKIRCTGENHPFSGYFDCNLQYKDATLPNIHRVVFCYTQHVWYSEKYDEIDTVHAVGFIVNGKEDGKWQYYKGNTDTLLVECYFVKGKLSGPLTVYNKKGERYTDIYIKGKNTNVHKKCIRKKSLYIGDTD